MSAANAFGFVLACGAFSTLTACAPHVFGAAPVEPYDGETAIGDMEPTSPPDICAMGDVKHCTTRCYAGNGPSCDNLGAMLELGSGVGRDVPRALSFYDRACAIGAEGGCINSARLRGVHPVAPGEPLADTER